MGQPSAVCKHGRSVLCNQCAAEQYFALEQRALRAATALRDVKARVERWRYQTSNCQACRQSPHRSDCVVVEIVTLIDGALRP